MQWKTAPDAKKNQRMLNRGAMLHVIHPFIKASTYTIQASALRDLENDPDVAFVSPDRPVKSTLDYTTTAVNAPYAWTRGFIGSGIGVAVIDSGMIASPDLTLHNNIIYNQDFTGEIKQNANVLDTK